MHPDVRQLLEDLRHYATIIAGHRLTRDADLAAEAQQLAPEAVSTLELTDYLERIEASLPDVTSGYQQAALVTARAWFTYWNGATMIERDVLPGWREDLVEVIDSGGVISAIDVAIKRGGEPPGWDNIGKRAI